MAIYRSGTSGLWAWLWLGEKERPVALSEGTPAVKACPQREGDGEAFGLRDRNVSGISSAAIKNVKFAQLFLRADIVLSALHVTFY